MKSTLKFEKLSIRVADYAKESSLPSLSRPGEKVVECISELSEDDGLFVGYGMLRDIFPYRMQDLYTRNLKDTNLDIAILENEHIKATFAPTLGGKLLSLIDKKTNKNLLFTNSVIQPCNLALRNAWTSGGVEWNIGMVGHSPFTCSTLFTSTLTDDDGTPVLRMYEYERIRKVTYQMDFYIPENSKFLHCRMRIVNPNNFVVPMYWWSNIAVPEDKNSRVIVPADCAYTSEIIGGKRVVMKLPIPYCEGFDATYPTNTADESRDYFYRTDDNKSRYIAYLDGDGYGLLQTSTSRLQGRKLFVWGQGPGAKHWQDFLSETDKGNYVEIQAGLARSQYEHIPMQPKTAWEWIELYGPVQCKPKKVHGDFDVAQKEVEKALSRAVNHTALEEELISSKKSIALKKADKCIFNGSAWGQLENLLRKENGSSPLSEHLNFGKIGKAQQAWKSLITDGTVGEHNPDDIPPSWMLQDEFTALLKDATESKDKENWYTWLQLGAIYLCTDRFDNAEKALKNSVKLQKSCWAYYCLAILSLHKNDTLSAKKYALAAVKLKNNDISLIRGIFAVLNKCESFEDIVKIYNGIESKIQNDSRVKVLYVYALGHSGEYEKAFQLLTENDGLILNDVKEEEVILSDLYVYLKLKLAELSGEKIEEINVPYNIDFRIKPEKFTYR